jgi:5-methylthioadenosine/S-adenosylhomocysteine deaminase
LEFIVRGQYVLTDVSRGENGIINNGGVLVSKDKIIETGKFDNLKNKYPHAKILGGANKLVMPGLIDAHSHGFGLSVPQRGKEYDFLENYFIDGPALVELDPELNAILSAITHLKNGCTTIHHNKWGESLDFETPEKIINGYKKAGIRVAYSPGMRNLNCLTYNDEEFLKILPPDLQQETKKLMVFPNKEKMEEEYFQLFEFLFAKYNSDDLKVFFGPSWVQGSTDKFLEQVKTKADQLGRVPIHIHTLQTPLQKAYGLKKYGKSLLEHMNDLGIVKENLVLGHAVFLSESDIDLLASAHASVTTHPSCNFAVRNGIAPVYYLCKAGVNVALGIDDKGFNDDNDPFMELKMLFYLHRVPSFDLENAPALTSSDVLAMGTVNAAKVIGFEGVIGALKPGMKADIVVMSLKNMVDSPWISPDAKLLNILIHRWKGVDVETVIVGGKIIIESGEFLALDIDSIYEEARMQARMGPSDNQKNRIQLLKKLRPYYHKWYRDWVNYEFTPYYPVNSRY